MGEGSNHIGVGDAAIPMDTIEISAHDVLVFTWSGEAGQDLVLAALGADVDGPDHVVVFDAATLVPIGLTAYLAEGHGVSPAELTAVAETLDDLAGTIVVVSGRAFGQAASILRPTPDLKLVARFREAKAPPTAPRPIETESATGSLDGGPTKPPKSDARVGGMVALAVLMFLALFVVFFVMSAG